MNRTKSFEELLIRFERQEDTVLQLIKIIASTNQRLSNLEAKQKAMEKDGYLWNTIVSD